MKIYKKEKKSKIKILIISAVIIILGVIGFIVVNETINIKHDYSITKLVINNNDVTEYLKAKVYIDEDGEIYLSKEDIREFL